MSLNYYNINYDNKRLLINLFIKKNTLIWIIVINYIILFNLNKLL